VNHADTAIARVTLFAENFDGLPLAATVDEGNPFGVAGENVWTPTPPVGWHVDNSRMPGGGVTEFRGWTFVDPSWWVTTAGQRRDQFTKARGAMAVADPDEWDDKRRDLGFFDSFLNTPEFSLDGIEENSAVLTFGSDWRFEGLQTAILSVEFDGAGAIELLRWESNPSSPFFREDGANETINIDLNNPTDAAGMALHFGLTNAGNDWWWAIDNIAVTAVITLPEPTPGDFNDDSLLTATDIDLLSAFVRDGDNNSVFDLNGDGGVNDADRTIWVENLAGTFFGDADLNKEVAFADFLHLANTFSRTGGWAAGDFDGSGTVLFPDFLLLSANFGKSATAVAAVPEPNAAMLLLVGLVGLVRRCRTVAGSVL